MRNIWRIFARDVSHATRNVVAIIVSMGLVIVPALYAWYNIAASWNPYGNTKALKVAVANTDKGYKSDLIPIRINIGENVTSALRANHDLDWQFVDKDKAVDGVNSGEYYAALVIPQSFSADMMTLFSDEITHAQIEYYLNEKINPIAPHVTDAGATTVATTIDQTFTKTLSEVALDLTSNMMTYAQSPQMKQYVTNATAHIDTMSSDLRAAATQADAYAGLLGATSKIIDSTDKLIATAGDSAKSAKTIIQQGTDGANRLDKTIAAASSSIANGLDQSVKAYDGISAKIDKAFADAGTQSDQVVKLLNSLHDQIAGHADTYAGYAATLRDLAGKATLSVVKNALNRAADRAQAVHDKLDGVASSISKTVADINSGKTSIEQSRKDLKKEIADARASVEQVANDYRKNLKPQLDALTGSLDDVIAQTDTVIAGLDATSNGLSDINGDLTDSLGDMQKTLGEAAKELNASADKLDDLTSRLSGAANGDTSSLSQITSADPTTIATMLSAPVGVDRIAMYPAANYGSAMTPFYTVLCLWVGSIVLVAMMTVVISDRQKAQILGLGERLPLGEPMGMREALAAGRTIGPAAMLDVLNKPRPESPGNARRFGLHLYQEYFGRYMIFGSLALLQATLVCLGDLFYLGVQCEHPLLFLLTGWLTSLVFSLLVYTLTVSFGAIGKAISVVLLVMQVAGSGGTFPIETLPPFFQAVSKWLLFPYAVDAMHSAMAGAYGAEYWVSMGKLALFIIPSLLLGLVLRKPVIRLNDWVIRNLESTVVM